MIPSNDRSNLSQVTSEKLNSNPNMFGFDTTLSQANKPQQQHHFQDLIETEAELEKLTNTMQAFQKQAICCSTSFAGFSW